MIRLSLLQFRAQAITAAAVLAAFAILLASTGPHLASMYAASRINGCHPANCANLAAGFLTLLSNDGTYAALELLGVMLIVLTPAVIGLFWGAPLIAHELETGTTSLAWSQSITRTRWLAVKLTVGGLAAMAVTEGLSLMQAWWAAPIGRAVGHLGSSHFTLPGVLGFVLSRFSPLAFASQGITPLGYAAFAFALGTTAGALIRRTVPAMAVTLAVFAAVQIAMPLWIRPNLFPARHTVVSVSSLDSLRPDNLPGQAGAWLLSSETINGAGQPVHAAPAACPAPPVIKGSNEGSSEGAYLDCLTSHGIRELFSYQPASRYGAFQSAETAIYLVLALSLTGYCFRRINRHLS
jgi:ABC-2 family transporter protein